MPDYVLRGGERGEDGRIGPALLEETLTAPTVQAAVRLARKRDFSADDDRINALWLIDEIGNLVWSLRRGE